ncbi:tol-pal system YbgF family protein [Streptomyces sp. NPDC049813]|uniref:tol-pal system YbgF family protein n=1 Tax=Streptomyces sp. NPDC049813 TaxID=3365597 RepID=UPI0037991BC3
MDDFDRIFDPHYSAVDLFTDRQAEHTAFTEALSHHTRRVRGGTAVLGRTERENVMVFYGIGGIGKTALSTRLERWALGELPEGGGWGRPPAQDTAVRTVRLDFHGSAAVNATDIVLRLRAEVADLGNKFPAFDLGLAAWWSFASPGAPLPELRDARGFDVRAQITDTLNDILSDAGARLGVGPLTVRTGMRVVDAIRSRRLRDRTLRDCAPLAAVIDQARLNPTQYVAGTLAGLLAWDLERLPCAKRPLLVAFADAVEYVQGGDHTQERVLNRIVHLSPGVLWVVTSRSTLDWASTAAQAGLSAKGPHVWPGLRLDVRESQQHLVGDLSDTDVVRYLTAASGAAGNPVLGQDAIERIRRAAHGLPLYLDLSLSMARQSGDGDVPGTTFGQPLPHLVTRIFADLPDQEREVARAAALVPRFDPELVSRATGVLDGSARRFCTRSLVTADTHPLFPYRLHDAVRAGIADESLTLPGAWSAADRATCAAALVEVLRSRHADEATSVERRLETLELAVGLCRAHDLRAPWLLDAITELPGMGRITDRLTPPVTGTWADLMCGFLEAWRDRSLRRRIDYLRAFTASPLPDDIRRTALLWLALSHRTAGEAEPALRILRRLSAETPDSERLRFQVARTLRTLGRYEDLDRYLETPGLSDVTARERLRSDLAYDRGAVAASLAGPRRRAAHLRATGRHSTALENEVTLLWRSALLRRATANECGALIQEAERYASWLDLRTALAAKALYLAGDPDAFRRVAAETAAVLEVSGGSPGWREWAAALVHGLRVGDRGLCEETYAAWASTGRRRTPAYFVVDRLCVYAGYPPLCALPADAGTDGRGSAGRWRAVIRTLVEEG